MTSRFGSTTSPHSYHQLIERNKDLKALVISLQEIEKHENSPQNESVFAFLHNRLFSKQEPHVKLVADARVSQPLPNAQTPGVCNVVLVTVTPMNTLFYYRINIDYMICCSFS